MISSADGEDVFLIRQLKTPEEGIKCELHMQSDSLPKWAVAM